ncbi:MAG TPA: hypothetical protein EYP56_12310 [Planctomycetaceae bacterium]|nr:hypothetical protein [Planctomycetaceae bacterium]HIQ20931.1 hypothetical protein [Planctomycetota bacterium]
MIAGDIQRGAAAAGGPADAVQQGDSRSDVAGARVSGPTRTTAAGNGLSPQRLGALAEVFFELVHRSLLEEHGRGRAFGQARRYLRQRGLDLDHLDDLPLGWVGDREQIFRRLLAAGFSPAQIAASRLLADRRLPGRILGPIRDPSGRIVAFWAWRPDGGGPRYLFWKSGFDEQPGALGLDSAHGEGCGRPGDVLLVEDVLDALLLQSRGLANVGAIGGGPEQMHPGRWERLARQGVRRATLAIPQNPTAMVATLQALENGFRACPSPELFVLVPHPNAPLVLDQPWTPLPRGHRTQTLEGQPIHGYRYMALAILRKYCCSAGWSEAGREAARAEAAALHALARPDQRDQLDRHFTPVFSSYFSSYPERPPGETKPRQGAVIRTEPSAAELPDRPATEPPTAEPFCTLHRCRATDCFCFD